MTDKLPMKEIQQDAKGYFLPARAEVRLQKCTRCKSLKPLDQYRSKKLCITCCEVKLAWKRKQKRMEIDLPATALRTV